MNLPPLHKLDARACPPCTPTTRTTPTDVSVHELLLLAEERDRLKAESELALQLQRASLQGGEADADAEPPALPDADSSIECAICFGSLLKGSGDEPYPPQSLQGGAYGRPYVTVCANGHLFHKECIKRHLANNDRCPECRENIFRRLDLNLYPKEEQGRVQRDLWKYAEEGQPEVVAYLLAVGAGPNLSALGGWNALMLAAMANHINVVKVLLADPRTNVWLRGGSQQQTAFGLAVTRRGVDDPVAKLIGDVMATLDDPEAERAAEAAAPAPEPAQPPAPEQPPVFAPQTAADRARGVRWDGQGTHPIVLSTWRNWWTTEGPGILNTWELDGDPTLHTRMGLEMARRLIRNKVEDFHDVHDLLFDIAILEVHSAAPANDRLPDFVDDLYSELEEAIYNELWYGVEFRVAAATARRADPAWRGPIFDWLMDGGLERVVDGFHETGLQRGRGGTAAARYVWVLNLRSSAEELAQRDATGGVDDFDHSLDHEYLAPNHNSWLRPPWSRAPRRTRPPAPAPAAPAAPEPSWERPSTPPAADDNLWGGFGPLTPPATWPDDNPSESLPSYGEGGFFPF